LVLMYDEDEPVLYIRIVLISIGPGLRELLRIPVPRTSMNKGKKSRARASSEAAYRGPRQLLPGSPTRSFVSLAGCLRTQCTQISRKLVVLGPLMTYREPTGVFNNYYRGLQQVLPGCSTKTTGVLDKNYRGAQQALPGCSTKTTGVPSKSLL
jgi:hypothetical protein